MAAACIALLKILFLTPLYFFRMRVMSPTPVPDQVKSVGLFHVPAHANGGGEKVLWAIVNKLIEEKKYKIVVYSDIVDKEDMIGKVNKFFGYSIKSDDFTLIQLESGYLTYSDHWSLFSRYIEGLSHFAVTFTALEKFMPDVFIETFTAHFSPIAAKLLNPNLKVITYVHYPYTSTEFVGGYWHTLTGAGVSIKNRLFAAWKVVYHYTLYLIYGTMGWFNDVCYTNSSWTQNHMEGNWPGKCSVLYPPCNVDEFWSQDFSNKKKVVVSLAQYRSEKRHDVQLDMMKYHQERHPESDIVLKIMGSAKFEDSEKIYNHLVDRVNKEKIRNVQVLKNLDFKEVMKHMKEASFGVHTMIDEHFGISIVEMLAGGLVCLAHRSAGPRDDILGNHTHELHGLLAKDDADFNVTFNRMIEDFNDAAKKQDLLKMVQRGQKFAQEHLSNEAFSTKFVAKIAEFDKEFRAGAAQRAKEAAQKAKETVKQEKNKKKNGDGDL
jgi:alpha-1,2-mannosyltransferase